MEERKERGTLEKLREGLVTVYVLIMLGIFPLYARFDFICDLAARFGVEWNGKYYDILGAKFSFFWKLTLCFTVLVGILSIFDYVGKKRREALARLVMGSPAKKRSWRSLLSALWKESSAVDKAFTLFLLLNILSMLLSGYPYETWWGNLGRNMGVLMWLMLYFAYLMISRCYRFRRWHINVFLVSGILVCLWGITDFFYMDVMGFFSEVEGDVRNIFVSSFGNINSYTSFIGILFSLSAFYFIKERKWGSRIIAMLSFLLSVLALVYGTSDNAVLSILASLALLPFVAVQSNSDLKKYLLLLALVFAGMRVAVVLGNAGMETVISHGGEEGILFQMGGKAVTGYVAALLFLATIMGGHFWNKKKRGKGQEEEKNLQRLIRRVLLSVLAAGAALLVLILILANSGQFEELWAPYRKFLIINDDWGTGRGFAWRMSLQFFAEKMTVIQKLFGCGPESYYMITMDNFFSNMVQAGYGVFDNAHNEYLNDLLSVGIFGAFSWIALILIQAGILYRSAAEGESGALCPGVLVMLLAYAIQALVNIRVPLVFPFIILLTSMCFSKKTCKMENKVYNVANS